MTDDILTPDAALILAKRLIEEDKPAAAMETYRGILAEYPRHRKALKELKNLEKTIPSQSNGGNLQADMEKLMQLYTTKKLDQAMTHAKHLCRRYPDQPMPFNILGVIHASRGNNDEAVQNYAQALSIAPEYLDAHNNLGAALHALGNHEAAIRCYQKVISINPRDADAFFNQGNSFMSLGRYLQAVQCYQLSIEFRPLYAAAHYSLGTALKDLGQPEQALESFKNTVKIDPTLVNAHLRIGNLLREMNLYDAAIAALNAGLALNPDSQEIKHFLNEAQNHDDN
ncbi:MAG: tetratricopeptide repeat protein [Halioglobus sp.]